MTKGNPGNRFSTEVRARAVRMVLENEADYKSRSQAVASIAEKFGCSCATLRGWINRQAIEDGELPSNRRISLTFKRDYTLY